MSITHSELRRTARKLMGDSTNYPDAKFEESDFTRALNWAQRQVVGDNSSHEAFKESDIVDLTDDESEFPDTFNSHLLCRRIDTSNQDKRSRLTPKTATQMHRDDPDWVNAAASENPDKLVIKSTEDGMRYLVWPPVSATVTDGLFRQWTRRPPALAEDEDTSIVLEVIPEEFDDQLLQAGAVFFLLNEESGTEDSQVAKFQAMFQEQRQRFTCRLNEMVVLED